MRRLCLVLLAACAALALTAPAASAVSGWCSESGDTCYSTQKIGGIRYVSVAYAAKYKTRERLCVVGPNEERNCVTGKLRRGKFDQYSLRLRWSKHFPNHGKGTYTLESPSPEPITFRVG